MSDIVIKVEGLSKRYRIGQYVGGGMYRYKALRDVLTDVMYAPFRRLRARSKQQTVGSNQTHMSCKLTPDTQHLSPNFIWALKDVCFEVKQGEVVGIIGRNGAGKTTLLKVLSRITEPTEGRAEIKGRVGTLLEVGTGFHPELTGWENIYLSGTILGMTKKEIDRKFDEIVAFAELEKFINTPVKRYSSGMWVRLGFAVAAHLKSEILLVDEVLAVGDAAFQKKCLGKMDDVAKEGRTILFISHNMAAVENLCGRAIVLETGRIAKLGSTSDCIRFYLDQFNIESPTRLSVRKDRRGTGRIQITDVFFERDGKPSSTVQTGKPCSVCFEYKAEGEQRNVSIAFTIRDERSQFLVRPSSEDTGQDFSIVPKQGIFRCRINRLPLVPGRYRITTRVMVNLEEADYLEGATFMVVEEGDFFGTGRVNPHSPVLLDHAWGLQSLTVM